VETSGVPYVGTDGSTVDEPITTTRTNAEPTRVSRPRETVNWKTYTPERVVGNVTSVAESAGLTIVAVSGPAT
jgi:hypothetical protein